MPAILMTMFLAGANAPDVPDPATLRAAVQQWLEQVAFRSTYRLRVGFAKSKEQALRGEIDPELSRVSHEACGIFDKPGAGFEACGVFNKSGPKMRCSFDAGVAGVQYGRTKYDITREPVDEATDGFVGIRIFPKRHELFGDVAKAAYIRRWEQLAGKAWSAGDMTAKQVSPLNPMYADESQPFAGLRIVRIRTLDGEHLEAICQGRELKRRRRVDSWETRDRRIVFWTKPTPPVVERVEEVVERITRDEPSKVLRRDEYQAILSDFRECPGGWVARRVLLVALQQNDVIRVREWRSDDLGDQPPTEADFAVTIPSDVRVVGIKRGFPTGSVRAMDPSKVNLLDLEDDNLAAKPPRRRPLLQTGLGKLLLAWGVGIAVFVLIAGWSLFKGRARGPDVDE